MMVWLEGEREVMDMVIRRLRELWKTYIKFPFHTAEYLMVNEIIDPRCKISFDKEARVPS